MCSGIELLQCYVMMSACSVVRFCAVVNKLHFYFYILVISILYDASCVSVSGFPKYVPYHALVFYFKHFINVAYVIMVSPMRCCQHKCLNTNMMYIFAACGLKSLYVDVFMSYED
jgi:hypothetical protein